MYPGPVDGGGAASGGGHQVQQEQDLGLRVERHPRNNLFLFDYFYLDFIVFSPKIHNWVNN